ncbi:uncharacterized protein [Triticum aestivum]|uniref:uncharacterized protein isoform X1 n=1 Tax=Triticum aestivum TaxID=4565 RepID=UPI001D00857E|nr:uncharacterized protein LOC123058670 isoform X1 [Triticum aestivum]
MHLLSSPEFPKLPPLQWHTSPIPRTRCSGNDILGARRSRTEQNPDVGLVEPERPCGGRRSTATAGSSSKPSSPLVTSAAPTCPAGFLDVVASYSSATPVQVLLPALTNAVVVDPCRGKVARVPLSDVRTRASLWLSVASSQHRAAQQERRPCIYLELHQTPATIGS